MSECLVLVNTGKGDQRPDGGTVDCIYYARLERYPSHSTTLVARGTAHAGEPLTISFPARRVARALYRFTLKATAPLNAGPPTTVTSEPFLLPVAKTGSR